jgi:hypothetical protein
MKFDYKKQLQNLKSFVLKKFKCGTNPAKDNVIASLEAS